MKRLLASYGRACASRRLAGAAGLAPALGSWTGRYTLGGPGELSLASAAGRASSPWARRTQTCRPCRSTTAGGRVRFQLPGRPAPLVFDGAVVAARLAGTVRQGSRTARSPRAAERRRVWSRGALPTGGGHRSRRRRPLRAGAARRSRLGRVRGLYPSGAAFVIGSGFATRRPDGTALVRRRGRAHRGDVHAAACACASSRCGSEAATRCSRGDAHASAGRGPAPSRRVRARVGSDRARVPARAARAARAPRRRRPRLRQARDRPVGRLVPRRVADARRERRPCPRRGGSGPIPRGSARGRPGARRTCRVTARPVGSCRSPRRASLRSVSSSLFSGPAVTADENDVYQDLAGEGERPAQLSDAEIDAEVLAAGRAASTRSRGSGSSGSRCSGCTAAATDRSRRGLSERRLGPIAPGPAATSRSSTSRKRTMRSSRRRPA